MHRIETTYGRPDLARIVAGWLVAEFGYPGGRTLEQVVARILAPPNGPEETFVLFEQDRPVGTASLSHDDLASRPDLTPWLAGVFVEPAARGRGHASALVRRVEAFAAAAGCRRCGCTPGPQRRCIHGWDGSLSVPTRTVEKTSC
jgi:GNAT superfamily N-acetyltransferase